MDFLIECFFILCLQAVGCFAYQYPVLLAIDKRCANDGMGDVWRAFFNEDKITLIGSGVILFFQCVVHGAIEYFDLPIKNSVLEFDFWPNRITYIGGSLILALVLGFGGQGILYGTLGKAESFLRNKFGTKQ